MVSKIPLKKFNKIYKSKRQLFEAINVFYKTPSFNSPACDLPYLLQLEEDEPKIFTLKRPINELPDYETKMCHYGVNELHEFTEKNLQENDLKPLGFSLNKTANKEFYIIVLKQTMKDPNSYLY